MQKYQLVVYSLRLTKVSCFRSVGGNWLLHFLITFRHFILRHARKRQSLFPLCINCVAFLILNMENSPHEPSNVAESSNNQRSNAENSNEQMHFHNDSDFDVSNAQLTCHYLMQHSVTVSFLLVCIGCKYFYHIYILYSN